MWSAEFFYKQSIRTSKTVGSTTTRYFVQGSTILAEQGANGLIWYYYDANGISGMQYNGQEYFFQKNLLGDIIGIWNNYGSKVGTYTYDAWGKVLSQTDNAVTKANPFRYRGYYYDTETSLYYLNTRYYDPQTGRFLNADSPLNSLMQIGCTDTFNLYAYALNNPVMHTDANGQFVITLTALLIAAAIGFVIGASVGAYYGYNTALANGDNPWKGALIGGLAGGFMGAGAGIAGLFIAPILAGGTVAFGGSLAFLGTGTLAAGWLTCFNNYCWYIFITSCYCFCFLATQNNNL